MYQVPRGESQACVVGLAVILAGKSRFRVNLTFVFGIIGYVSGEFTYFMGGNSFLLDAVSGCVSICHTVPSMAPGNISRGGEILAAWTRR